MIPDFEIITHRFPNRQDITIVPISDVHLGARECMEQEFMAFISEIEKQPDTYVLLLGDLLNNCTRTSVSDIFEETMRPSEARKMLLPTSHNVQTIRLAGDHKEISVTM